MLQKFQEICSNTLRVEPKVLQEAEVLARSQNLLLLHALIRLKAAESSKLLAAWAHCFKLQIADLDSMDIPQDIIQIIPDMIARQARSVPIDRVGNNIIVAMENPHDIRIINLLQLKTGYSLKTVLTSEDKINRALARYYPVKGIEIEKYF
jgi:type IV pilus assembly protein PilB